MVLEKNPVFMNLQLFWSTVCTCSLQLALIYSQCICLTESGIKKIQWSMWPANNHSIHVVAKLIHAVIDAT